MRNFLLLFSAFFLVGCGESQEEEQLLEPEVEATATIFSLSLADFQEPWSSYTNYVPMQEKIGTAHFSQTGEIVTVTIELNGQTPNTMRAVHIHNGTIDKPLRHWNQQSYERFCNTRSLGELWAKLFAGDVGNVPIDENGNGTLILRTDLWALNSGDEKDILDKVLVVHQDAEDFSGGCDPMQNHDHESNLKIGGGIISLITPVERNPNISGAFQGPDFTVCK